MVTPPRALPRLLYGASSSSCLDPLVAWARFLPVPLPPIQSAPGGLGPALAGLSLTSPAGAAIVRGEDS